MSISEFLSRPLVRGDEAVVVVLCGGDAVVQLDGNMESDRILAMIVLAYMEARGRRCK